MPEASPVATSTRDLQLLVRSLRGFEDQKELKKILTTAMRTGGKPMLKAARTAVKALPSKGGPRVGRPGLRAATAKATKLQVRTGKGAGVVIRVDPRKMPPGMNNLPAYMEGRPPFERHRHPVFGPRDSEPYAAQPATPYFFAAIAQHQGAALAALEDAVDTVRRRLEA